jgi:hypothetical protein
MFMLLLILLIAVSVSADEICYTDSTILKDPTYTDPQIVSLELTERGLYRFYPDPYDRFAIGSGVNLDPDRVIQIYEFAKEDTVATLTSHHESSELAAVKLDLAQPFEIRMDGPIQLFQNGELITEFVSFLRMPFHIGWRRGTLCYEFEELEDSEESEEPQVSQISQTPLNTITPFDEL